MPPKPQTTHPNAEAFPKGLSGPALRALHHAGVKTMTDLTKHTETEIAALHGMGPKGIRMLNEGLGLRKQHFRIPK